MKQGNTTLANRLHGAVRLLSLLALLTGIPAGSASAFSLVRDVETERTIREYARPIFEAADLAPKSVKIYLVDDKELNAFVMGGQNIFLNTGLLMAAKDYTEVAGVIAHETGHIVGGHLARMRDAQQNANILGIVTTAIGVGAGLLAGRGDLAAASAAAGSSVATSDLLSFSRAQESAADQAALRLLDATQTSAKGLSDFLGLLQDQELLSARHQDPYVRTHPLSRERIDTIHAHLERSKYSDVPPDPTLQAKHERIRAKVFAYTQPLGLVLREYPETDQSIPARYARTFAYYRKPNFDKAMAGIDQLISEFPNDPYFHELRAEILFEHGMAVEAAESFKAATEILPDSALLRVLYAQALIAIDDPARLHEAEQNLEVSLLTEPKSSFAWRQLAIAYGRQDKIGKSALALGEEALLQGRYKDAAFQAKKAEAMFDNGSKEWIQAQDILNLANQKLEK